MNRPYFDKSIAELEMAYRENASDVQFCKILLNELEHRTTQRAHRLKGKLTAASDLTVKTKATPKAPIEREPTVVNTDNELVATKAAQKKPLPVPRFEPAPKPPVTNDPQNILRAWTALEVLAPQGYRREVDLVGGRRNMIAQLEDPLPWVRGVKPPPKKRLYYELILGTINLGPAVEELLKLYADNRPDMPLSNRKSPIASLILDKNGCPLDENNSFAISSFAWGVPVALQGDLKLLAEWTQCEKNLKTDFKAQLIGRDQNEEILPLSNRHITEMHDYLVEALNLHGHEITPPTFAIKRYEFFASKVPPEPGLLNSFFLQDLAKARELVQTSKLPRALAHYLGVIKPPSKTDLLENEAGLQDLLQPALTPLGRRPAKGRFPLAMLQQAAVNATTEKIHETGISSVNGPPGTGKTTLLRDIVAARIIDRAQVMSSFSDPATAFSETKQFMQRQGAKITLHTLDDRLKGFEMVVASSNNKAAENVSAELPALDAVASDAPDLRYFKSISDNVIKTKTWGLISAVLGNSSNRFEFTRHFWKDEECGLSTLPNHISGAPQIAVEPQDNGEVIKRPRRVIVNEAPPNNTRDAKIRWSTAKTAFEEAVAKSKAIQSHLQEIHEELMRLHEIDQQLAQYTDELPAVHKQAKQLHAQLPDFENAHNEAQGHLNTRQRELEICKTKRPGFFARLFRTKRARRWAATLNGFKVKVADLHIATHAKSEELQAHHDKVKKAVQKYKGLQSDIDRYQVLRDETQARLDRAATKIGAVIPDWKFFAGAHEEIQMANLWFDEASSRTRDLVFEKAMALHRAFIECSADRIRQNLSIFVESYGTRPLGQPAKDALIPDLWATFFLVVPVVSTTFASVTNMFSRLEPATLGWLLIDEAGQALPQATVGAMMRCKRAVIVGDPMQIEPVVTLPKKLTEEICGFFGIDPLKYNAPDASLQTVADMASPYCTRFPIGSGHRDVGAPLLVHRRCDSPMFDISNEIGYSNLMVQAKKPSNQDRPLGRSYWFDIVGTPGPDKWCGYEAIKLIELLGHLRASGADPDMYIVTPFVIVQDNLRRKLIASKILDGWTDKVPNKWVYEHVGTVHTVQGREAATVFFVLGAQMPAQNGARAWAGGNPNLVNVAVTRAKSSLYVIGNRQLWKSAGYFSTVDRFLPN